MEEEATNERDHDDGEACSEPEPEADDPQPQPEAEGDSNGKAGPAEWPMRFARKVKSVSPAPRSAPAPTACTPSET